MDQKLILGESGAVDVGDGDGGGFRSDARQLEAGAVRDQQVRQLAAEDIVGDAAQKCCRHSQPCQRARRVERPPAGDGALRAVVVVDDVDQRLAADDDHGRISPEPRVIIRVRTTGAS